MESSYDFREFVTLFLQDNPSASPEEIAEAWADNVVDDNGDDPPDWEDSVADALESLPLVMQEITRHEHH